MKNVMLFALWMKYWRKEQLVRIRVNSHERPRDSVRMSFNRRHWMAVHLEHKRWGEAIVSRGSTMQTFLHHSIRTKENSFCKLFRFPQVKTPQTALYLWCAITFIHFLACLAECRLCYWLRCTRLRALAGTGLGCALGLPAHPEAAASDALRRHPSVRSSLDVFCLNGFGQVLSSMELATSPDWLQEH